MHGLICKAVEGFVIDQHGPGTWSVIRAEAGVDFEHFESLRVYDGILAEHVFDATATALRRDRNVLFEDVGGWICTHPSLEAIRRLIRFTGKTFVNLLYALDEVHDRACMAVPGLNLPRYHLERDGDGEFEITCRWTVAGGAAVLIGVLRAMADDYGALALIDAGDARHEGGVWIEHVHISIVEQSYQAPREFTLGGLA